MNIIGPSGKRRNPGNTLGSPRDGRYDAPMLHEVWVSVGEADTVCLAGPQGELSRILLAKGATMAWTFDADSRAEAMTIYHKWRGLGPFVSAHPEVDTVTYAELGIN